MSARVEASAIKGSLNRELRLAANRSIADARRAGLSGEHAHVLERAVGVANKLAFLAPAGSTVSVDLVLQGNPISPDGWSVSVLVTAEPRS